MPQDRFHFIKQVLRSALTLSGAVLFYYFVPVANEDHPIWRWSLFIVGLDSTIVNIALPDIGRDLHASVAGLQWTVEPMMRLDGIHAVQIAGLFGVLEPGHQARDVRRMDRLWRTTHGRRNENEGADTGWMQKCCVERDPSTLGASNKDRRRAVSCGVNHRQQIRDSGKVFLFRARLAKAPPIVCDRPVACADRIQLRAPHAAVADRGVQKDDRVAVADDRRSQHGLAGGNLMI